MLMVRVIKNSVTLVESELPDLDDDEILVAMHSCGICGSDLEKVYGNYGMKSVRVGHEPAGRVIKIGKILKISRSETGYLFIIMLVAMHVDIVFKVIIQCVIIIKIAILTLVAYPNNLLFQNGILNVVVY